MKRILMILAVGLIAVCSLSARDRVVRSTELPEAAQQFITKNFGAKTVHHAKVDRSTYDVVLTNGTEIEFDRNGALKEINCGVKGVPDEIVPQAILDYVKRYFKGEKIVEMEVTRHGYEVELTNGVDIKFDASGRFVKYDR